MVLNGLLDVSCAAELQFNEPFSQQLVELFKHSATTGMLGPVHDRHTSVLEGSTNKAAGIFWNGCITARIKIEEKQDTRLKASQDTDIVMRCRQALSCWNEKVMCVCLCAGWDLEGGRGLLWVMAPVWQGSDRYVIMLTTILPPIVLPETNLLKIHPVPSSPSSANSLQREWGWQKEKRDWESGEEY